MRLDLKVSDAANERGIIVELPANTQFLSPRLSMNNRAKAAGVPLDCTRVCIKNDY